MHAAGPVILREDIRRREWRRAAYVHPKHAEIPRGSNESRAQEAQHLGSLGRCVLLNGRPATPDSLEDLGGLQAGIAYDEAVVVHHDQGHRHPEKIKRTIVDFQNADRAMCEEYVRVVPDMEVPRCVARATKEYRHVDSE